MRDEPEHEVFGRDIAFEDIREIKRVFQPSMLNSSSFFNPAPMREAVRELCGWGSQKIWVYFRNMGINIESKDRKENWWDTFKDFSGRVQHFPAGSELEYWYGPSGNASSSPEFNEDSPPYQAFVRLFDKAIQGFSCFVSMTIRTP
ncbi:MAG: hypothetical protein QF486_03350 [Candidatus Woesearchaeota archaeon]|jgi:hypothetical protein|nr:hypothetical protein [Candidatus Woesearchaeota archaeon]MDP7198632.1 hypothetical protein [Candidatus Woesearchaeota archaeon]MDP7466626.1 hypothetical protein [Candidatus Woesearchaeota archaeon]MDP7646882.1 hypothetical protein [Candidatus Woesearchaeota archaeon]|tara:strand:+ start:288 stop:725 length:438 start_codon:yes stop_codon:yes gene_type:complete